MSRTNRCTVTPGDSSPTLVNRRRGPPPTTRPTHGFYAAGAIALSYSDRFPCLRRTKPIRPNTTNHTPPRRKKRYEIQPASSKESSKNSYWWWRSAKTYMSTNKSPRTMYAMFEVRAVISCVRLGRFESSVHKLPIREQLENYLQQSARRCAPKLRNVNW